MDECAPFFNLSLVLVSYRIEIKTGDVIGAGTNANAGIILHGQGNATEEFRLSKPWEDGFIRGKTRGFCVMSEVNIPEVTSIELWRDSDGVFSNWNVDYVEVTNLVTDISSMFPVMSWVEANERYRVEHTYESDAFEKDYELQAWGAEIVKSRDEGGVGILGVPNNGIFQTADQLITTLTAVIYTCSVGHAAVNFQQYDEYASPFNYPYTLYGQPPTTKEELTKDDILSSIVNRLGLLNVMSSTAILSEKGTQSLGDFEVEYIVDPPAVKILNEFISQLRSAEIIIDRRNAKREFPYDFLHPQVIPNSISI